MYQVAVKQILHNKREATSIHNVLWKTDNGQKDIHRERWLLPILVLLCAGNVLLLRRRRQLHLQLLSNLLGMLDARYHTIIERHNIQFDLVVDA